MPRRSTKKHSISILKPTQPTPVGTPSPTPSEGEQVAEQFIFNGFIPDNATPDHDEPVTMPAFSCDTMSQDELSQFMLLPTDSFCGQIQESDRPINVQVDDNGCDLHHGGGVTASNLIYPEQGEAETLDTTTSSISPLPGSSDTTSQPTTDDPGQWLSTKGKKRATSGTPAGEKKKRQKKLKPTDAVTSFGPVPLTHPSWPNKVGFPLPLPDRVFYNTQDPNVELEVYSHPNIPGVSIRHYANAPYEKRINLSTTLFHKLQDASDILLTNYDRIQQDAGSGMRTSTPYVHTLDAFGCVKVLVNMYRGRGKVHIGTPSYIKEMIDMTKLTARQPKSTQHCGSTMSVHALRDINQRVGRVLQDYTWKADTTPVVID